ncbi:HlyD family secretion protein [Terriglobus aquaticus]|uniref:HlyD family secretion protein n=1 Tax=Terriglobus aquaticus TaxID=940139 RepID=A0ABW9KKL9_9BACT|nr:HlyD family secretion protein [Terriglobus aquaticus]
MAENDPNYSEQQNRQANLPGGGETSVSGGGTQAQAAPAANAQAPAAKPENPAGKARRTFIIVAVVLLLVLIAGFFYYRSTFTEGTDDAQVDGDLYQVSARVAGQVTKVYVTDNQKVNQGDVIAEIDPRDYQVALEQAEAQLANAKASYVQANVNVPIIGVQTRTTVATSGQDVATGEAGVAQANKQVAAAQARVDEAKANALKAQLDVDRYTPLVAKDVISKQQFDQAVASAAATNASLLEAQQNVIAQQAAVRQAQARLDASRATARQAQVTQPQQIQAQQARANAANADIQQQQARVDQARLNLSYCRIVAPTTGIINRKSVAVGGNVSVGQNLLTIVPLTNLWITANYKETQLQHMKVGQKVDIKVDALGGREYHGTVAQIGGATGSRLSLFPPENATGNYVKVVQRIPVRINLDQGENNDQLLRAGYSVDPEVHVK